MGKLLSLQQRIAFIQERLDLGVLRGTLTYDETRRMHRCLAQVTAASRSGETEAHLHRMLDALMPTFDLSGCDD